MTHACSYLVTFSYDWDDDYTVFMTTQALDDWIRDSFDLQDEPAPFDSPDYWAAVMEAYEAGKWKSFQIFTIHWETQEITEWTPA